MSVLIEGMEIPKDRQQLLWIYPNGKALTLQSDVDPWKELQAVPVPEPHGRLGDLDKLNEEVRLLIKENMLSRDDARDLLKTMDDAHTIIPASESEERPAFLPQYELTPRKTNADRIRSMTDEELAEFLGDNDSNFPIGDHKKEWLDLLRQEAK